MDSSLIRYPDVSSLDWTQARSGYELDTMVDWSMTPTLTIGPERGQPAYDFDAVSAASATRSKLVERGLISPSLYVADRAPTERRDLWEHSQAYGAGRHEQALRVAGTMADAAGAPGFRLDRGIVDHDGDEWEGVPISQLFAPTQGESFWDSTIGLAIGYGLLAAVLGPVGIAFGVWLRERKVKSDREYYRQQSIEQRRLSRSRS